MTPQALLFVSSLVHFVPRNDVCKTGKDTTRLLLFSQEWSSYNKVNFGRRSSHDYASEFGE